MCKERSVHIKWKVNKSMSGNPARLLLGNCFPTSFTNTSNGDAEAEFIYQLADCEFKKMVSWDFSSRKILCDIVMETFLFPLPNQSTWKYSIYENKLTYRPLPKPYPPSFTYPVRCMYDRWDNITVLCVFLKTRSHC